MAATKKTKTTKKKTAKKTTKKTSKKTTKKTSSAAATKKTTVKKTKAVPVDLDRKGLAAKARQLKLELLAIRFNLQTPSLKDYRLKKRELASVLNQLG